MGKLILAATLVVHATEQRVCIVDVSGEATSSALSAYLCAFGYSVTPAEPKMTIADYRSATMICADVDRLTKLPPRGQSERMPIVVALTRFGDATADTVIANGAADAAISRPLLRSEIEELLRRVAAGEKQLHSRTSEQRRDGRLPGFTNLRVLVADDNAVNREVAVEALSQLGAQVETVENGVDAVRAAAKCSHDIILMDGSMPQMDGYTAARTIRQAEKSQKRFRIPIIALTAHVIGAAADEWRLAGMDAVIHKPFTIAQLAKCLLEQVPQFQTSSDELESENHDAVVENEVDSGAPNPDRDVDLLLVDRAIVGQLRKLNEAKKGDFLERVVELYCAHAPKAFEQLRQHAKAGEAEACGALAHSLKSMSLNIGAIEVAKAAAGFEQLARRERKVPDHTKLDALLNSLERTLAALLNEIGEKYEGRPKVKTGLAAPTPVLQADSLEKDLCLAIERRELDVEYQPFVDRAGKQVLGVETLVRWKRGGTDNVPPSVFIPIAERNGLIEELGEWVLRRACEDALNWPTLTTVSPIQFRRPGFADRIEQILSETAIGSGRIELEITETALIEAEVAVQQTIELLHHRGVSFALDDFGTGYSGLTNLRRFPIDKIKIDRSFVSNLGSTVDATIIHAVVSIGRALGLKVVAEGVETIEQQKFVAAAGVHAMQGYLFARPMRHTQVAAFVAEFDDCFRAAATVIP